MGIFEKYLSIWVGICIIAGVLFGNLSPPTFEKIASLEYSHVTLVVALFIWVMI